MTCMGMEINESSTRSLMKEDRMYVSPNNGTVNIDMVVWRFWKMLCQFFFADAFGFHWETCVSFLLGLMI